jgi:predicted ATP-dependent serine protease
MNKIMLGYDFQMFCMQGWEIPLYAPLDGHYIVVGGSGSGKSTAVLYWLYKCRKQNIKLYIADFKASKEFSGITENFAEFEECYDLIKAYYEEFLATPEGGDDCIKVLLIDEIAGLLTHFSMTKQKQMK